jgi:hypothetical protein
MPPKKSAPSKGDVTESLRMIAKKHEEELQENIEWIRANKPALSVIVDDTSGQKLFANLTPSASSVHPRDISKATKVWGESLVTFS